MFGTCPLTFRVMNALLALARRWPYSAPVTFVGLMWTTYAWSIWMAGGIDMRPSFWMGGLKGAGYWLTGSVYTPSVTHDQEWERLVSAIFLHGGFVHILFNSSAILQLGGVLERFTTPARCWFTLLLSGLCGSLATVAWAVISGTPNNAVGASGAASGVGAALIVLSRGIPSLEEFRKQMITWVGITLLMGFMPMISGTGHFGGAVGGAVAGVLIARRGSLELRRDRYGRALLAATVVLALVFAAALALNAKRTLDRRAASEQMAAATNEVHIWLDEGVVTGFVAWREQVAAVRLPGIFEPSRLSLIHLGEQLSVMPGGAIDTKTAEEARLWIRGLRWW